MVERSNMTAVLSVALNASRTGPTSFPGSDAVWTTMVMPRAGRWARGWKVSHRAPLSMPCRRMSPAMPATVNQGCFDLGPPNRNRFPMGSSPGQKRFAMVSLTITTPGASAESCSSKNRPLRNGTCIVWK